MSLRRYCASCRIDIWLKVGGKKRIIKFINRNQEDKEWFFDTDDKEVQSALEATKDFGNYFYKSHEYDWMEAEEKLNPVIPEVREKKTFSTNKEAKEWINKKGVPFHKVVNREQLISEYAKLGYDLEFK